MFCVQGLMVKWHRVDEKNMWCNGKRIVCQPPWGIIYGNHEAVHKLPVRVKVEEEGTMYCAGRYLFSETRVLINAAGLPRQFTHAQMRHLMKHYGDLWTMAASDLQTCHEYGTGPYLALRHHSLLPELMNSSDLQSLLGRVIRPVVQGKRTPSYILGDE